MSILIEIAVLLTLLLVKTRVSGTRMDFLPDTLMDMLRV